MREYQEASTAVPMSLPPATPSPDLKSRMLAAATGHAKPPPAILSRVFWSAAAVLLVAFMIGSLFNPTEYEFELSLKGTDAAPSAVGRLRWKENAVKVEVSGLPALPAGKEYQLWQIGPKGPEPIPARTFRLDTRGDLAGTDWMKHLVAKGQTFAFTVEPAGGSRTPTAPLFAVGKIN